MSMTDSIYNQKNKIYCDYSLLYNEVIKLYDEYNLFEIKEKLSLLPQLPGCYLMKNKDGIIILESDKRKEINENVPGLKLKDKRTYGRVIIRLYKLEE